MRLARPMAKLRYALLIPLALAALVSTPPHRATGAPCADANGRGTG